MTKITAPKVPVPIGRVTVNGVTLDVIQHPEFVRFFFDLFRRIGGTEAMTNTELETLIGSLDDAMVRLDALGASVGELRSALAAMQSGEMLAQPVPADVAPPDVMQAAQPDVYAGEMTWQI